MGGKTWILKEPLFKMAKRAKASQLNIDLVIYKFVSKGF
jgi:hypothetical protein